MLIKVEEVEVVDQSRRCRPRWKVLTKVDEVDQSG